MNLAIFLSVKEISVPRPRERLDVSQTERKDKRRKYYYLFGHKCLPLSINNL
jgi:hypothetical protein